LEVGVTPKFQIAGKTLTRALGLFVPIMRELSEMIYQYDQDYVFLSEKFEHRLGLKPTSYEEGLKEIVASDYGQLA
ncbi:MAG: NAD-dependent dehydratase, partial [Bacteroidota bacterium]